MNDAHILPAWLRVALVGLLCLSLDVQNSIASEDVHRTKEVKAAFVLNIARFAIWPSNVFEKENTPHLLCLYRSNPLNNSVETIRGKAISNRVLQVSTIKTLSESDNCTILLIPHQQMTRFKAELPKNHQRPMLTIADLTAKGSAAGITYRGVMVSMVRKGTRIGLEVNLQQTHQAGLQISSQLLKLARILDKGNER